MIPESDKPTGQRPLDALSPLSAQRPLEPRPTPAVPGMSAGAQVPSPISAPAVADSSDSVGGATSVDDEATAQPEPSSHTDETYDDHLGDSDEALRRTAYTMWEDEGRPEGRHEDHWHRAREHHGGSRKG